MERGVWSGHCRVEAIPVGGSEVQLDGLRLSLDLRLTPGAGAAVRPRSARGLRSRSRWLVAGVLVPLAMLAWWWVVLPGKTRPAPRPEAPTPAAVAQLPIPPPAASAVARSAPVPVPAPAAPGAPNAPAAEEGPRPPTIRPLTAGRGPRGASAEAAAPKAATAAAATTRGAAAPARGVEPTAPARTVEPRADRLDLFGDTK